MNLRPDEIIGKLLGSESGIFILFHFGLGQILTCTLF